MQEASASRFTFELWDLGSRNIIGEFSAEREALALVRSLAAECEPHVTEMFTLVREDEQGNSATVASGTDLINLALHSLQHAAVGGS